jgi:archaeosine-15-forming tRNA-guanine transglycosylase
MPISKKFLELDINKTREQILSKICSIFDFQFGLNSFRSVFKDSDDLSFEFSRNTGKLKSISLNKIRVFIYIPTSGRFNSTIEGANLLRNNIPSPHLRVVVMDEIQEFIKEGKSVFAKHIVDLDKGLRNGSEVIVVNGKDELLAIGKLTIPTRLYPGKSIGVGVKIRKGIGK